MSTPEEGLPVISSISTQRSTFYPIPVDFQGEITHPTNSTTRGHLSIPVPLNFNARRRFSTSVHLDFDTVTSISMLGCLSTIFLHIHLDLYAGPPPLPSTSILSTPGGAVPLEFHTSVQNIPLDFNARRARVPVDFD
jgi:hypothetical protein